MTTLRAVFLTAVAFSLIISGCGSNGTIKSGEIFGVTKELREKGESLWADGSIEGFTTIIPKGTIVKALYSQRPGINVIECEAIQINGKKNPDYIKSIILPPTLQEQAGLRSYSITLSTDIIGSGLKKLKIN